MITLTRDMLECQEMRMFSLVLLLIVVSSEPIDVCKNVVTEPIDVCKNVVTFNAGLNKNVPNYETRRNAIPKAILDLNSDVVCLQEFWAKQDLDNLLSKVKPIYPHYMSSVLNMKNEVVACSNNHMTYFTALLRTCGCNDAFQASVIAGLHCLVAKCRDQLKNNTIRFTHCLSCIVWTSQAPGANIQDCTRPGKVSNRLESFGLVLLSKKPIVNEHYGIFFPFYGSVFPRGFLQAIHPDLGKIFCVQQSSPRIPYLEYNFNFSNYAALQQEELRPFLYGNDNLSHILMGDFNSGPHIMNRDPERNLSSGNSRGFDFLIKQGYTSDYILEDGRCTVCKSNPLVVNGANELSDHIFVKNRKYFTTAFQRVFYEKPLSDHYGVQAYLCKLL